MSEAARFDVPPARDAPGTGTALQERSLPACPACGASDTWGGLVRWVSTGAAEAPCGRCDTRFTFVLEDSGWRVAGVGSAATLTSTAPTRVKRGQAVEH